MTIGLLSVTITSMSKEFELYPKLIRRSLIHTAENLRVSGKLTDAVRLASQARINPEKLSSNLSNDGLSDLMQAWRIDVVTNTSLAKRTWNGKRAVRHLGEAKKVIKTYYDNSYVLEKAPQFKQDNEGNPYNFDAEILRDKGRYCLVAAALTGNASFIDAAKDLFLKAGTAEAEEHPFRGLGLAWMELGITIKNFELIRSGYEGTYLRPVTWGNLDRARWAARTYFGESVTRGKISESMRALKDLARVRRNPIKILTDCAVGITRSSDIISTPVNWLRRKTLPKHFNSENLKI